MPYKRFCANQKKFWKFEFVILSKCQYQGKICSVGPVFLAITTYCMPTLGIVWLLSFEKRTTATQATFVYFRYFTLLGLTLHDKLNKAMKTPIRVESKIYFFPQGLIYAYLSWEQHCNEITSNDQWKHCKCSGSTSNDYGLLQSSRDVWYCKNYIASIFPVSSELFSLMNSRMPPHLEFLPSLDILSKISGIPNLDNSNMENNIPNPMNSKDTIFMTLRKWLCLVRNHTSAGFMSCNSWCIWLPLPSYGGQWKERKLACTALQISFRWSWSLHQHIAECRQENWPKFNR